MVILEVLLLTACVVLAMRQSVSRRLAGGVSDQRGNRLFWCHRDRARRFYQIRKMSAAVNDTGPVNWQKVCSPPATSPLKS